MSMAERKTMTRAVKNPVKRKLTRAEKKEIAAVIQAAKGDGKPRTAQQTIPYLQMYPDGICRVTEKKYSKSLVFEDINYPVRQNDRNLPLLFGIAYPICNHDKPGMGTDRQQLLKSPVRYRFSRLPHNDMCRHLCGFGKQYDYCG